MKNVLLLVAFVALMLVTHTTNAGVVVQTYDPAWAGVDVRVDVPYIRKYREVRREVYVVPTPTPAPPPVLVPAPLQPDVILVPRRWWVEPRPRAYIYEVK